MLAANDDVAKPVRQLRQYCLCALETHVAIMDVFNEHGPVSVMGKHEASEAEVARR